MLGGVSTRGLTGVGGPIEACTIRKAVSSISPWASANRILSFRAALSVGSAQAVYWAIASRTSTIASSTASFGTEFRTLGEESPPTEELCSALSLFDSVLFFPSLALEVPNSWLLEGLPLRSEP
ncbi:hypothetical protein Rs2_28333 [Raphanus sativus]|nr:hypothetical protein Rs2_28333 [Raphanus sativus]